MPTLETTNEPAASADIETAIGKRMVQSDYEILKAERDSLKAQLETEKRLHMDALNFIDQMSRPKLAKILLDNTKLTIEDIERMPTAQMDSLVETLKIVKKTVAGVSAGADVSKPESGLTAGDKFKYDRPSKKLYDRS